MLQLHKTSRNALEEMKHTSHSKSSQKEQQQSKPTSSKCTMTKSECLNDIKKDELRYKVSPECK